MPWWQFILAIPYHISGSFFLESFFNWSYSCLPYFQNDHIITKRDEEPRPEQSNGIVSLHVCMCVSTRASVCVYTDNVLTFTNIPPESNASQNPHLLEKVVKRVIGNTVKITFLYCTKVLFILNWVLSSQWLVLYQQSGYLEQLSR